MFNLQGSELIIILLLALVVLGPEKLPDAMRRAGKLYAELKKMSAGFQQEFRSVVDEPMREVRDTANMLRDSADFTKLQSGERAEKPKSAEMVAPADPDAAPVADVPSFEGTLPPDGPRDETSDRAPGDPSEDQSDDGAAAAADRIIPSPAPFSSSQRLSASAPSAERSPDLFARAERSSAAAPPPDHDRGAEGDRPAADPVAAPGQPSADESRPPDAVADEEPSE